MKPYVFIITASILLSALSGCDKRFQGSYKSLEDYPGKLSFDFNSDGTVDVMEGFQHFKGKYTDSGNHVTVEIVHGNEPQKFELDRQGDALVIQVESLHKAFRLERH